ncbi:dynein axonemal assembly factor 6 isoform X2 [Hyperolius riggenbachi]|uniref:dynein axonemal assembly factor 6 isoform X2 n=1 Tax=Hyperolius riggenbachi TaxID=752182 RepID=UPI0035A2DC20
MEHPLSDFSSISSLKSLCTLLSDPVEENENQCSAFLGPGEIGPVKKLQQNDSTSTQIPKDKKQIWNSTEVPEGSEYDDSLDPRERPEYEILFKQRVGSEDIFLGMSQKDPSTACCEDMVFRIRLPGTKSSDVSLDVRRKYLDLRTPKQRLKAVNSPAVTCSRSQAW